MKKNILILLMVLLLFSGSPIYATSNEEVLLVSFSEQTSRLAAYEEKIKFNKTNLASIEDAKKNLSVAEDKLDRTNLEKAAETVEHIKYSFLKFKFQSRLDKVNSKVVALETEEQERIEEEARLLAEAEAKAEAERVAQAEAQAQAQVQAQAQAQVQAQAQQVATANGGGSSKGGNGGSSESTSGKVTASSGGGGNKKESNKTYIIEPDELEYVRSYDIDEGYRWIEEYKLKDDSSVDVSGWVSLEDK